jgi:hypothetical protein
VGFSGTVAVRAMKFGDYAATIFPGTPTGIQAAITYLGATGGEIRIGAGTVDFGTSTLTILQPNIKICGAGVRATKFTYSGTGDFLTIGFDDGLHSGVGGAYNGIAAQIVLEDIWFAGPGKGTTARAIVDWENGSQIYTRLTVSAFGTGYQGIGADVSEFHGCYYSGCGTGCFLTSRCDQNTFYSCYFTGCDVGATVEFAWGSRFFGCQFVFNLVADAKFDAPAAGTSGGDVRLDVASTFAGCWFESATAAPLPRHIWVGSNGTAARRVEGVSVYGGYVLCSNTTNFVDCEAGSRIALRDVYQGGTLTGSLVNVVNVAGLTPTVLIDECRNNGGALLGGTLGANQSLRQGWRRISDNAFAASFTPNALGGELVQIGALTANITINAPTNPFRGLHLTFVFVQDGTGGRTVTWNAVFKVHWRDDGNVAGRRSTIRFYYDGANWQQVGAQEPWTGGWTLTGRGTDIVAAATIAIPTDGDVFHVTGNTNITNGITVNTIDAGRTVVLIFDGTPTVSDTGTSKLNGAFVATADDTLTLKCDASNWYELARSTN